MCKCSILMPRLKTGAKWIWTANLAACAHVPLVFWNCVWLCVLFLGCFIDKQQAGSVEGIKVLHRAESWFDKYTLPSGNPGSDTSWAQGDWMVASSAAMTNACAPFYTMLTRTGHAHQGGRLPSFYPRIKGLLQCCPTMRSLFVSLFCHTVSKSDLLHAPPCIHRLNCMYVSAS